MVRRCSGFPGRAGSRAAYHLGRGSIVMRGKVEIETSRGDRETIVVSEIPFQVNKATMVERIGELWRDTELHLPGDFAATRWRCAISGREYGFPSADSAPSSESNSIRVPIAALLGAAPVALLLPIRDADDAPP